MTYHRRGDLSGAYVAHGEMKVAQCKLAARKDLGDSVHEDIRGIKYPQAQGKYSMPQACIEQVQ
jgi:hypothetical protein